MFLHNPLRRSTLPPPHMPHERQIRRLYPQIHHLGYARCRLWRYELDPMAQFD